MSTMSFEPRARDATREGVVARDSDGRWGPYHRMTCVRAPHRGDPGVRDVVHGPWRYLSHHWAPCDLCRPPVEDRERPAA
jgi:hypothetical protein